LAGQQDQLRIVADQFGAPTGAELVADVTAAAIAALARQDNPLASGIYHLAAAGRTSWYEFGRFIVSEAIERGAMLRATADAIEPIASSEYPTAAKRPANSTLDTAKLRAALGMDLPDWTIGARLTIAGLLERRVA
jgi:dTDP-4-dehydrorhamnose reductase